MDYYRVLGLEPKLQLDTAGLQQVFYARSRELHPDRFARASREAQAAALEESSLLNDAYRTLRDPAARVEYFLKAKGLDIATQGTKNVPPELLEEVFELNMLLEELKEGGAGARPQVEQAREQFTDLLAKSDAEMAALCAAYDTAPGESKLQDLRQLLNRRRYITNLLRDIDGHLSN
jgi:molecular chaperone HscB